jgi:hypothetical protein
MSDYDATLRDLTRLWDRHDPMPRGLVERVLVAIETDDLDREYELLHLVERSHGLAGTRAVAEAITISFAVGDFALMLRVSATRDGYRRVDGWATPPSRMRVTLSQHDHAVEADVDERGRFEFSEVPVGLTRFWLASTADSGRERLFSTPIVEL